MDTESIANKIVQDATSCCKKEFEIWRQENSELIGQLLQHHRISDTLEIFFKQGFATGMKFGREIREKIKNS